MGSSYSIKCNVSRFVNKKSLKAIVVEQQFFFDQGRVFFDVPVSKVVEVLKLRCVDNVWVLIGVWPKLDFDLKNTPQVNVTLSTFFSSK
jgi:hypothetical protein